MKVNIKKFGVDMEVKNTGVEFQVNDTDGSLKGDLYVTKGHLIWCSGRTKKENGVKISWNEFINWAEDN